MPGQKPAPHRRTPRAQRRAIQRAMTRADPTTRTRIGRSVGYSDAELAEIGRLIERGDGPPQRRRNQPVPGGLKSRAAYAQGDPTASPFYRGLIPRYPSVEELLRRVEERARALGSNPDGLAAAGDYAEAASAVVGPMAAALAFPAPGAEERP